MTRRPTASIVASPVLVGAVTVLVTIVAVFLAYNANQGLPFVPTYDVSAEIPGGQNLVAGNEVRMGGFRVGLVEDIRPGLAERDGERESIAVIDMKLDKRVEPLPIDSQVTVRPRSALGLKYVEIAPGRGGDGYEPGATIPLSNARERVEFDDVLATFDAELRDDSRASLRGFGDALAGRGQSLNRAIEELRPFVVHLQPVMETLSDPDTQLDDFFRQLGRASAQVAPVARVQAELFTDMAETFEAVSRCPECLQDTIAKAPSTLDAGIRSFRVQRPFLNDFAVLSSKLRPAARQLPRSLPALNDALRAGRPVLARSVGFSRDQQTVFAALDELAENPNTLLALKDLRATLTVGTPLLEYLTPYQTVCNNWIYFFNALGTHFSEGVTGGTAEYVLLGSTNRTQDDNIGDSAGDRPADVPRSANAQTATDPAGEPLTRLNAQPYVGAIDSEGRADCERGQTGYLQGPYLPPWTRYGPSDDPKALGGSHTVGLNDVPGRQGGTYVSRRLGIDSLQDAERLLEERGRPDELVEGRR